MTVSYNYFFTFDKKMPSGTSIYKKGIQIVK